MSDFVYQDLLPLGADTAPYRKLTSDYVSTFEGGGQTFHKWVQRILDTGNADLNGLFEPIRRAAE